MSKKVYNITNEAPRSNGDNNIVWVVLVLLVLLVVAFILYFKKPAITVPTVEDITNTTTNTVKETIKEVVVTGVEKVLPTGILLPTEKPVEATTTPVL